MAPIEQEKSLRERVQEQFALGVQFLEENAHRIAATGASITALAGVAPASAAEISEYQRPYPVYTAAQPTETLGAIQNSGQAGSGTVVMAAPGSNQDTMDDIGARQIHAIPGFNYVVKQPVETIEANGSMTKTSYTCPPASKKSRGVQVETVETMSGNKGKITFCASDKIIQVAPPKTSDSTYSKALTKFVSDPLRSTLWGGDEWKYNMYTNCPFALDNQEADAKLKYHKRKDTLSVVMNGIEVPKYCEMVGQYTQEVTAQVRKPGKRHFRNVGKTVLHVTGLREILSSNYGMPYEQMRIKVTLPEVKNICNTTGKRRHKTQMRIKVANRFTPNHSQQFVHDSNGSSNRMVSKYQLRMSDRKKVCR